MKRPWPWCRHCDRSLLSHYAWAGSPSQPYWVTFEGEPGDKHLGFHCDTSPDGRHEPPPKRFDNSPGWWVLPHRWWPGNWNVGWPT